ncbi:MAG: hypothetical protein WCA81_09040 [Rhizomicrobium sp.]
MANRKVDMVPGKAVGFQNTPRPSSKTAKPIKGPTIKATPKAPAPKQQKVPKFPSAEKSQSPAAQDMPNPLAKQTLFGGKKGHVQYK